MGKLQKFACSVLTLCLVCIPLTTPAYVLEGVKWQTSVSSLTYTWGNNLQSTGTVCRTAFQTAIGDWNSTATPVYFSYSSSSYNVLNTYTLVDNSEYGATYVTQSGSAIVYFTSELNVGNTDITTTNVARSAANHELGHGLGLADASSSSTAVMNQNRNRTVIYVPQTDDINGVNYMY